MRITVVGGGNIGTQFAVHCAEKGHEVTIHTSKPELFVHELTVQNHEGVVLHRGEIKLATDDDHIAFADADFVFITLPAFCMKDIADRIEPYAKSGLVVGLVPGTGGGECAFRKCIDKGVIVFGLQRVPSVARLIEYGKSVCATGYREKLHVSAIPNSKSKEIAAVISSIFDMKCEQLPCYLNLTLTPSNPILHTTRLRTIFENYSHGVTYDSLPLFYEEWSDTSSILLFSCDDEVQRICQALSMFDLCEVRSLKIHYESSTPEALTKKIRSIEGFKGLKTPSVVENGRYTPDLHSRYFTADFSYGLEIIKQIAGIWGINVPNIEQTMQWYERIALEKQKFSYAEYGIESKTAFLDFYAR